MKQNIVNLGSGPVVGHPNPTKLVTCIAPFITIFYDPDRPSYLRLINTRAFYWAVWTVLHDSVREIRSRSRSCLGPGKECIGWLKNVSGEPIQVNDIRQALRTSIRECFRLKPLSRSLMSNLGTNHGTCISIISRKPTRLFEVGSVLLHSSTPPCLSSPVPASRFPCSSPNTTHLVRHDFGNERPSSSWLHSATGPSRLVQSCAARSTP